MVRIVDKTYIAFSEQKNVILEQKLFLRCVIIKAAEQTAVFICIRLASANHV